MCQPKLLSRAGASDTEPEMLFYADCGPRIPSMARYALLLFAILLQPQPILAEDKPGLIAHPLVTLHTTEGDIVLELDYKRAPYTVENFVQLAESGYYDGTIFHRVVRNFVVQGGGFDTEYEGKEAAASIPNESGNGLSNRRGTVALARTNEPHSGNAQFFINVRDNVALNPQADRWGYAVFGKVITGMEFVDVIASLPTGPGGPFKSEVPTLPIIIEKVSVEAR